MTTSHRGDGLVMRFLDGFLQEKNIKWVLAAGLLILLGSSLMMVMPHWDAFGPFWQLLTLVAYTSAVFGAGWWSCHRLGLRKTGHALLALTVLLLPVACAAWHKLWQASGSATAQSAALLALGLTGGVTAVISRLAFRHLLRGAPPGFVASYVLLSLAGGVAPILRGTGAVWVSLVSLALWGVASIGIVKVNRHVFWMTEERRQPRLFGFFPVILLGGQFLAVFGANFAASVSLDWMGFGCTLVAIPVLLTADAVARVYQERTGNLVRPWPWSVVMPLAAGLVLCAAGVCLAGGAIVRQVPYALVPTAVLTGLMMAVAARRTHHTAFVWASLAAVVLAYNFTPIYFQTLARAAVRQGAAALDEPRLPLAFYGLTYLPLIVLLSVAAVWFERRGHLLFARPLRQSCVAISLVLLAAAIGHMKATLPVGAAMTGVFAGLTWLLQDRRLALAAAAALAVATAGVAPLAGVVGGTLWPQAGYYLFPLVGATVVLVVSGPLDRLLDRVPLRGQWFLPIAGHLSRTPALAGAIGLAVGWCLRGEREPLSSSLPVGLGIGVLLFAHTLVWQRDALSWLAYGFAVAEGARILDDEPLTYRQLMALATLVLLAQWALSYVLARYPATLVARAWSNVNRQAAWGGLSLTMILVVVPDVIGATLGQGVSPIEVVRNALMTAWCWDAVRRLGGWPRDAADAATREGRKVGSATPVCWRAPLQSTGTVLGCVSALGTLSSCLVLWYGPSGRSWIPVAWAGLAVAALPWLGWARRRFARRTSQAELLPDPGAESDGVFRTSGRGAGRFRTDVWDDDGLVRRSWHPVLHPVDGLVVAILAASMVLQFLVLQGPFRWAGFLGTAGMLLAGLQRRQSAMVFAAAIAGNWALLLACVQWFAPSAGNVLELLLADKGAAPWLTASGGAVSLLIWQFASSRVPPWLTEPAAVQRRLLGGSVALSLALTIGSGRVAPFLESLAVLSFVLLAASELGAALRRRQESHVWRAEGILLLGFAYVTFQGLVLLDRAALLYGVLASGFLFHVAGTFAARRPAVGILSRPFLRTGRSLPLAAVAVGVLRHVADWDAAGWRGTNSLALLLAGGFYFWLAVEHHSRRCAVVAAAVLNIALALLWRELEFHDPQFYMVPLGLSVLALVETLKREIPLAWHNPMRYAGALTILVSPTFHMVHGSWLHLLALMIASIGVLLLSIGLRVRALMYTGTAFLVADLVGMVVCGGLEHSSVLWIAGVGLGSSVVALGAICEHQREKLLQRMRVMSARLEQWE